MERKGQVIFSMNPKNLNISKCKKENPSYFSKKVAKNLKGFIFLK